MAIFQPSNIIPSSFAGVEYSAIDATSAVNISWQVNGNSPMQAFQIKVYNNAESDITKSLVKDTGIITDGIPTGGFYGTDSKGNYQTFVYAPENQTWNSDTWGTSSNGGISNGNEYKMVIIQYWGTLSEGVYSNSVTQYSGSVFLTRETPQLLLNTSDEHSAAYLYRVLDANGTPSGNVYFYDDEWGNIYFTLPVTLVLYDGIIITAEGAGELKLFYIHNQTWYQIEATITDNGGVNITDKISYTDSTSVSFKTDFDFYAEYTQSESDSVEWVEWKIGVANLSGWGNKEKILKEVLYETNKIYTQKLSFNPNFLQTNNLYVITCKIQTQSGLTRETSMVFLTYYNEAISSGNFTAQCMPDDSVLLSWEKGVNIPGTLIPAGVPIVENGYLSLTDEQKVIWDKVEDESMNFSPWSLAWSGKIGKSETKIYEVETKATATEKELEVKATAEEYVFESEKYNTSHWFCANSDTYTIYVEPYFYRGWIEGSNQYDIGEGIYRTSDFENWERAYSESYGYSMGSIQSLAGGKINSKELLVSYEYKASLGYSRSRLLFYGYINTDYSLSSAYGVQTFCIKQENGNDIFLLTYYNGTKAYIYSMNNYISDVKAGDYEPRGLDLIYESSDIITEDNKANYYVSCAYTNGIFVYCNSIENPRVFNYFPSLPENNTLSPTNLGLKQEVVSFNGKFYLASSGGVFSSTDGINWTNELSVITDIIIAGDTVLVFDDTYKIIYFLLANGEWKETPYSDIANDLVVLKTNLAYGRGIYTLYHPYEPGYSYAFKDLNLKTIYTYEQKIENVEGWLAKYENEVNSGYLSELKAEQSAVNGDITLTITTYTPTVDLNLTYTLYSEYSSGELIATASGDEELTSVGVVSSSPNSTVSVSNVSNKITISVTTATPSAKDATTKVSVSLFLNYDSLYQYGENPLVLINNQYEIRLNKKLENYVVNYNLTVYDVVNEEYLLFIYRNITAPQISSSLYLGIFFSDSMLTMSLSDDNWNRYTLDSYNINKIINNLNSLILLGPQQCDYIYVTSEEILSAVNFTPQRNENTLLFADFDNQTDALQAGTVSTSGTISNTLYKVTKDNKLIYLLNVPSSISQIKDYGTRSAEENAYEMFYFNDNSGYSSPTISNSICKNFSAYSLIEAVEDSSNSNVFHVLKVWRFGNNISMGSLSNNNTPNWLTNFTPYRVKQASSRLGKTGTLEALLSNYNLSENFYSDTVQMMDDLYKASASKNTFFLKDIKGNLYMVAISAPIVQTINTKSKIQEVKVSISWEEVGDATGLAIIQLPTDEGWQQDQVYNVELFVDTNTGVLYAIYPSNYYGSKFNLENNVLVATAPNGIKQASFVIEDGALIAVDDSEN